MSVESLPEDQLMMTFFMDSPKKKNRLAIGGGVLVKIRISRLHSSYALAFYSRLLFRTLHLEGCQL
ncbi:hypothetical protein JCM19235_3249 [Vibrio maritimus]|uniref:Uncharacterized protein n=1 Tax=Vibrio maritimus TaxID=990268 RepID=A0A090S835_9VIBR|nr:hypothetical protein JCM19235_3249 [Vibrio maritimus]